ncbi:lysozyme inhibitor LprI family protein [Rheinheimera sp.]|uniref:lysozyme inhibitor LprI family protein n=1 Tax=Rheinheimera sp. TaxID=1869214 RepID=UPI0027354F62|nr:lysozyme inhibitor LprI family protein [Rheinheimera sp.]MDP2714374.1 lysozyme inhibitor LprI family protein [Rheinheimera sp.]
MNKITAFVFAIATFPCFSPLACELPEALCSALTEYELADSELNNTYRRIMQKIAADEFEGYRVAKADIKDSLVKGQRAWLKYRDANCEAYYTLFSGGTSRNVDRTQCLTEMTNTRVLLLKKVYL